MSKSYDLSTSTKWANLADGEHVVKLRAKGAGFGSSSFSNSVTVTKGATGETWVLNASINTETEFDADVSFVDSSGSAYNSISAARYTETGEPPLGAYGVTYYKSSTGIGDYAYTTSGSIVGWHDQAYRTITFTQPVTDTTLLAWLQANGTKQGGG